MEICGEAIQGTKMSSIEIVDLCNSDDDEVENVGSEPAKKLIEIKKETCQVTENIIQVASEGNRSSSALSTCHSYSTRQMEEMVAPLYVDVDDTTGLSLPPFCRNFWRAGYHHDNNGLSSKLNFPSKLLHFFFPLINNLNILYQPTKPHSIFYISKINADLLFLVIIFLTFRG